jgi:hypothetical protein
MENLRICTVLSLVFKEVCDMISIIQGFKKILMLLSVSIGVLFLSSCGKESTKGTNEKQTVIAKKSPSFLFVLQAHKGEIKKTKDGKIHLVLSKDQVHHVIMFSDRPNRIVRIITEEKLKSMWKEGKDSFENDPPNAVLSYSSKGEQAKAQIVILNGMTVTKKIVEFPISISNNEKKVIGSIDDRDISDITLTVDDIVYDCAWGFIDVTAYADSIVHGICDSTPSDKQKPTPSIRQSKCCEYLCDGKCKKYDVSCDGSARPKKC